MALETIENKKFLNGDGVGHLWEKIRNRYDEKLDEIAAGNDSVKITDKNKVEVVISTEEDNLLQLKASGNKGLYVKAPSAADTYSIVKDATSGDYAAVYHLKKFANGAGEGVNVGVDINIPKDMVVSSGTVVTKTTEGDWGTAGTYIELTLANATNDKLYIPVDGLIEYVTSGSQTGDMVMVNIDDNHKVTATITDGTITKAKLTQGLQASIDLADNSVQSVTEGSTNGTISVDGDDVAVHGLGTAAYAAATDFDASGAAAAVLGADTDLATANTVYGAKKYASDAYAAIVAMTNAEIDTAIATANSNLDG